MKQDRRKFIKDSLAATTTLAATAPMFVPRTAWGANERVTYGLIGAGGRGRGVSRTFQKLGAQCVAVAEVYEPNLETGMKESTGAKSYVDYKELLTQSGMDAVIIATPDHQHYPNLLAALSAKKDVYLEKPMSHSLEESQKMVEAVRKSKQIVQIGMQRRSAESLIKAKGLIDSGVLGRITLIKPQWNWNTAKPIDNSPLPGKLDWKRFLGPAKETKLEPMKFRRWRYFWDYSGGNMTDQGTHLMDVVQWFTGAGVPRSAVSFGQVAKMTGSETPDVFCAVFEYPNFMATWTLNYSNSYENGWSIRFEGDQGTMVIDEDAVRVWAEPWKSNREPIHNFAAPVPLESHVQNFLDSVKSRKEPNAPVEVGASAVSGPHLANLAHHKGQRVQMNARGEKA